MADGEALAGLAAARRGAAAILFLQSATNALDAYSAVNSSPWTAETVTGGDPEKESSLQRYCMHAIGQTVFINGVAAIIAGDGLWPFVLFGSGLEVGYMSWLYYDAVKRGRNSKQDAFGVAA